MHFDFVRNPIPPLHHGPLLIALFLQDAPSRSPLAATPSLPSISTAESNDAHNDNVNFLRSRVRSPPDPSSSLLSRQRRRRQHILSQLNNDPMDLNENMAVEINRRMPILRPQFPDPDEESYGTINNSNLPNYEGRVSNPLGLYGWAPASDDEGDDIPYPPIHNNALSSWLGRLSERSNSRRSARRDGAPRNPQANHNELADGNHGTNDTSGSTTESLLQSIQRQPRFSRTRTLHDYLLDRAEEPRERAGVESSPRAYRFLPSGRSEPHRALTHNDLRARVSAHRQMHLDNPPSPRLKETIRYLNRLRYSNSFEESLSSAAAGGFVQLDLLSWDNDDFILDTSSIYPPPVCSWLRPGMTFSGFQRAASSTGLVFPQQGPSLSSNDPMVVNGSDQNRISVQTSNGRRYFASQVYNLGSGKDENWPVKVTIHDINVHEMTLSGTMEAYNIPDKASPSHDAHIVTFLEGEIIDFNLHTLETKNFKADAEIDCTYWRKLQPFKNLTDEEMTRNLVSRKWITEQLSKGWILMRWKGLFSPPPRFNTNLTIYNYRTMFHNSYGCATGAHDIRFLLHFLASRERQH